VNLPVVIAGFVLTLRLVKESREPSARRLDVAGTGLAALTLAAVTFAIVQTGRAAIDASVVVAAVAAALALTVFLRVEWKGRDPMLPLGLLRRASFSAANAVAYAMNLATVGLLFVLTLFLQTVQHRSALAGLASATNNTSRIAGSAVGIAAFGAVAGAPSAAPSFVQGLHADALVAAGLWVAAALATVALIASTRAPARRRTRA
jgi:DHA2 family methylenomycin A resistance protein-like MFS transporter